MRHQIGDVTLIRGDCLEVMPTLKSSSVNMVFADLPYNITDCHWDRLALPLRTIQDAQRWCVKEKAIRIYTAVQPFTTAIISAFDDFRYDIVWHRKAARGFQTANKRPMRGHETILVFGKPGGCYNPQKTEAAKKTCYTPYLRKSEVYGGKPEQTKKIVYTTRHPTTVLQVDESDLRHDTLNGHASKRVHPTQKPVALLEWLVRTYTNDGDTILDPVAGSGTTAIAAMRVGNRKVICIEKDETYYDIMVKRVQDEQSKAGA